MGSPKSSKVPHSWEEAIKPELKGQGVFLSPEIAAEGLSLAYDTVLALLRSGELKGVQIGRKWFISRDWLMEYTHLE